VTTTHTSLKTPAIFFIAALALLLLFLITCKITAQAETITVDANGNGDHTTIQNAIDAADEDDTIRVWAGVYYENVVVNKTVSIVGNGSANTSIEGDGNGHTVTIRADQVNLSKFTVTGASGAGKRGVSVESDGNTISHTSCANNFLGISFIGVENNSCENNAVLSNTIGVYLGDKASNNSLLRNNISSGIYGIFVKEGCINIQVHYNLLYNNSQEGINATDNDGVVVNTTRNWWGHASGPYHATNNTKGQGDNVTNNVDFGPWYATPTTTPERELVEVRYNPVRALSDTIQGGVDAARDGDMVLVAGGVYYENVMVNKTLTIVGNGSATTTINASGTGDAMNITAGWCNVSGFTMTWANGDEQAGIHVISENNSISDTVCENNCYGIFLDPANGTTLTNNICSYNSWSGIRGTESASLTISANTCTNNSYGGIYLRSYWGYGNDNTLIDNICNNNLGGAGINIYSNDKLTDTLVKNNTCQNNSGDGILLHARILSDLIAIDNSLEDNTCLFNKGWGIAIKIRAPSSGMFKDHTLEGNNCSYNEKDGILIDFDGPDASNVKNNTVQDNGCWENARDGLRITRNGGFAIENNSCQSNSENGIYLFQSDGNTITGNTISSNARGIYLTGSSGDNEAHYNLLYNNSQEGINATDNDGYTVNATKNYWGHGSGPYHAVNNTGGKGDNVTDNVDFGPWYATSTTTPDREFVQAIYNPVRALSDTIQGGVDAARDGDMVLVAAGSYNENVVVDKTLTIMGEGPETTTINGGGNGDVVVVAADLVTLSGFHITNAGSSARGLFSDRDYGLYEDLKLTGNRYGAYLLDANSNTIRNSEFSGNTKAGIKLERSNGTLIIGNTLTQNEDAIALLGSSFNHILLNDARDNSDDGIDLDTGSDFNTVADNTASDNDFGIICTGARNNTIENNTANDNTYLGIALYVGSHNNTVRENEAGDNNGYGIAIESANGSLIIGNELDGNGIVLFSVGGGIYVSLSTGTIIEDNICTDSGTHGIELEGSLDTVIISNNCSDNKGHGIFIGDGSSADVEDTIIRDNRDDGIHLAPGTGATIRVSNCSNNGGDGVFLDEDAGATISDSTCSNNAGDGIFLGEFSYAAITDTICSNNGRDGIFLEEESGATITNNICTYNVYDGIEIFAYAGATITNNTCSNNGGSGIFNNGDYGTIENNTCSNNDNAGIFLFEFYDKTVENNVCSNNSHFGIYLFNSGYNTIESNICSNNGRDGIFLEEESGNNTFRFNTITGNDVGIYFFFSSDNTLEENNITENRVGIYLEWYSKYNTALSNSISGNTEYGIDASNNGGEFIDAGWNNWWGHASGPYHATNNTNGKGDNVTDYVDFVFWRGRPPFEDYTSPKATIDSVDPSDVVEGEEIQFTGHGTAYKSVERYVWTSSIDGELHSDINPDFSIDSLSNGTHTISFRVEDNFGIWSDPDTTTVTVNGIPGARNLTLSPNPATPEDTIILSGLGTDDGEIARYAWRKGGEELYNGTEDEFELPGLSVGTHTIHFKVQDDEGVWSPEISKTLVVHERPVAFIDSITPNPALNTKKIEFKGHGDDDGTIQLYVWRSSLSGELHNSTEADFTAFLGPGTHSITMVVMDDLGAWSAEVVETVIVHIRPTAAIVSILPIAPTEGGYVQFSGRGVDDGSITRYAWRSSLDGEFYNDTELLFTYSNLSAGSHTIYLKVQDNHGIWGQEVSLGLEIRGRPTADIVPLPSTSVSKGKDVHLAATTGAGSDIALYVWTSSRDGELYNGSEAEFSTSSLSPGEHVISLRVQDDHGVWSEISTTTLVVEEEEERDLSGVTTVLVVICVLMIALVLTIRLWYPSPEKKKR